MLGDKFFAAEIDQHIHCIDLHGCQTIVDALELLEREIFWCGQSGIPYAKVIYGIGSGNLSRAVQQRLDAHPMVVAAQVTGEGGSSFILF